MKQCRILFISFVLTHPFASAMLFPSLCKERGKVRWRTWGEFRLKHDNKLFSLLKRYRILIRMISFSVPDLRL